MAISYAAFKNTPLLDSEQERRFIRDWQVNKDRDALEALVLSHARMAYSMAFRLSSDATDREEMVSEGLLGLIRAADAFDLNMDVRFSTYAKWWVRNGVNAAYTQLQSVVNFPAHSAKSGSGQQVFAAIQSNRDMNGEDVIDKCQSPDPSPEDVVIAQSARLHMRRLIADAMSELGEMEKEVILARNLQVVPVPIEELAKNLGISRERLRQVERRALSRLKFGLLSRGVSSMQVG